VRLLVVRRRNRCWDDVPRFLCGEHLIIRSPAVSSTLLSRVCRPIPESLVWDRTRHVLRLRSALRDFFPVALQAFPDLDAPDALELLRRAADPDQAARLTRSRITAALRRVNRRDVDDKTAQLQAMLRAEQLRQPPVIQPPTPPS
jgi:hypothetical protein